MPILGEIWQDIQDFEGLYSVSNYGRVRSYPRDRRGRSGSSRRIPSRILVGSPAGKGYLSVTLVKEGRNHYRYVHHLVLEAFVGPCPDEMETCHEDGDRRNNRVANLRWDTHAKNIDDKKIHGTQTRGEKHHTSKVSDEIVIEIRRKRSDGAKLTSLEAEYGLSQAQLSRICNKKRWTHLE